MNQDLAVKQKPRIEHGKKQIIQHGKDINQIVLGKLKKDFTVKDGKVELIDGRWMTPRQLLEEVKRQMRALPELYDQRDTVSIEEPLITPQNACGTNCCIAGWMCLLTTGIDAVNLGDFERINQFLTGRHNWPWLFDAGWDGYTNEKDEIAKEYGDAKDGKGRVEAACKAIDLYIKENDLK